MAKELAQSYTGEPVLLAVSDAMAPAAVRGIQSNPRTRFGRVIPYVLIGPDTLGKASLLDALTEMQKNRFNKRNLTEGMHVVAPFLEDVANQQARDFRTAYRSRFKADPSVVAGGFHDAAAVVAEALSKLVTDPADLTEARKELRDRLAEIDRPEKSVTGVTGPLYFNRDGNSIKTVPIGVYRDNRLVSPPAQLSPALSSTRGADQKIYQIAGGYFTPTRVVPTGVRINAVRNIDFKAGTADLDFHIWFRHQGELDLTAVQFPNAVKPVQLRFPEEKRETDGQFYRLYRVEGTFATDFLGPVGIFDDRVIGFQLRHGLSNRERLILVPDLVGMDMGHDRPLTERVADVTKFADEAALAVDRVGIFLDAEPVALMGNPAFVGKKVEGFSRINLGIWVESTDLSFRDMIDTALVLKMFLMFGAVAGLIGIVADRYSRSPSRKWLWFPMVGAVLVMLVTAEPAFIGLFTKQIKSAHLAGLTPMAVQIL